MKFPSVQKLKQATVEVLTRFPLEIFCAAIGTSLLLWQIEQDKPEDGIIRIILCSLLGLVLFLSTTIFSESHKLAKRQRSLLQGAVVVVLTLCWFSIRPIENETSIMRYALFFAAFHLLVSFAPKTTVDGFWEYNKQLFLRILIAQLYSGVLFAGLAIAVGTTDFLFQIEFNPRVYARIFIVIIGMFNTIFFLAGVPSDFTSTQTYPKGLKIFTQYVLIPLATIYLAIILAYEGKVIVEWMLPTGVISWLILGYAVYGILSILLVYPVRKQEENKWISTYSKLFYVLLIPLLPLLCFAIGVRVLDYGITEPRYIVLILAVWLAGITLYFLIAKKQNIKVIPISLCIVALFSAWGPQSASSVSQRSQVERLINMFESQNSFKDGKLQPMPEPVADSIGNQTIDQLRFLTDKYGAISLASVLPVALNDSLLRVDTIKNVYTKRNRAYEIIRKGLALKSYYSTTDNKYQYFHATATDDPIELEGFAYLRNVTFNTGNTLERVTPRGDSLVFKSNEETRIFNLSPVFATIEKQLETEGVKYPNQVPVGQMTAESFAPDKAKLIIKNIAYDKDSTRRTLRQLEGLILYGQ